MAMINPNIPDAGRDHVVADEAPRGRHQAKGQWSAAQHALLLQLLQNFPFGICVVDADFRVVLASDEARRTFASVDPFIGCDLVAAMRKIWPQAYADDVLDRFRHTLATGEACAYRDAVVRRADRDALETYDWRVARIVMPDGRFGVVCYFYDLTERELLQTALRESRERLQQAVDAGHMGTFIWHVAENRFEPDARMRAIFDLNADDIPDFRSVIETMIHPSDRERCLRAVAAAFDPASRSDLQQDIRIFWSDGSEHWVRLAGRAIYEGDPPRVTRMAGTALDITQSKQIQEDQREIQEQQSFLLKLSDALRPLADAFDIQQTASRLLRERLGASRVVYWEASDVTVVKATAESVAEGLPPFLGKQFDISDYTTEAVAKFRHGLPVGRSDVESDDDLTPAQKATLVGSGARAYMSVPLVKAGRLDGHLAAYFNIPHRWLPAEIELIAVTAERTWAAVKRTRAETALRESEAQLAQANRAKDDFLAMLGHELRNPLAPITTTLQLMKLRAPDVLSEERGIIEAQVRYLTEMVDDLLDVARITRGKIVLTISSVRIDEVIAAAVASTQPLFEEREQTLLVRVEPGLLVSGDKRRLIQVMVNLLVNASKYSSKRTEVTVDAKAEAGEIALRVRDHGQGITPELLPKIFDLFTQDMQSLDRARGGLGLGLAIVHSIVALHGGNVIAMSEGRDKGSEFTVRLPLLDVQTAEQNSAARPPADATQAQGGPAESTRVLIVDDYEPAADSLAQLLQALGCETRVVHDGAAALQAVAAFKPTVALIDIGLPVMDGYEVARHVHAMHGFEHLPLIAITGYGQESDHARVLSAGFDEHLIKPLDSKKIAGLIEKLAHASRS